jgi:hypothetical protein
MALLCCGQLICQPFRELDCLWIIDRSAHQYMMLSLKNGNKIMYKPLWKCGVCQCIPLLVYVNLFTLWQDPQVSINIYIWLSKFWCPGWCYYFIAYSCISSQSVSVLGITECASAFFQCKLFMFIPCQIVVYCIYWYLNARNVLHLVWCIISLCYKRS